MNSAFIAVKGDDGILAYTGSTFPLPRGKYREYNDVIYRSNQTVAGGAFNAAHWDVIGLSSGTSISVGLITDSHLTGSTSGNTMRIGLSNTAVTPGTYQRATITVDQKGRIIYASGNTGVAGSDSQIQFNNLGQFGASTGYTFNLANKALTLGVRTGSVGLYSIAAGRSVASGSYSYAFGNTVTASTRNSFAIGVNTIASGAASFAGGESPELNKPILATGLVSFNFSYSDAVQEVGHGAIGNYSAILGGFNQHIGSTALYSAVLGGRLNKITGAATHSAIIGGLNNVISGSSVRSVILGGQNITLNGTYSDTAVVSNFAIFTTPSAGSTDDLLTWNATSKKVGKITQASISASISAVGPAGAVQYKNPSNALSGTSNFTWTQSTGILEISNSTKQGIFQTNNGRIFFGVNNGVGVSSQQNIFLFGSGNTTSGAGSGHHLVMIGADNSSTTIKNFNGVFGRSNTIGSNTSASYVFGSGNTIINNQITGSFAAGVKHRIWASYATTLGYNAQASGKAAFAGGIDESPTSIRPIISSGLASFAYTYNDGSQGSGHGALAPYSAILGGRNNYIVATNTGATIIGGNSVKLSTANIYAYHTAVSNLVINDTPSSHTTEDVLTWNASTKKVGKITQASLSPSSYSNVIFVSKLGNDSTGAANSIAKPFLTINAALVLASVQTKSATNKILVYVLPGEYTQASTLTTYSYVDFYFSEGTFINFTSTSGSFINFGNVGVNIYGFGTLLGSVATSQTLLDFQSAADVYFRKIKMTGNGGGRVYSDDANGPGFTLNLNVDTIELDGNNTFGRTNGVGNESKHFIRFRDFIHSGTGGSTELITAYSTGSNTRFYIKGERVLMSSLTGSCFLRVWNAYAYVDIVDIQTSYTAFSLAGGKTKFRGKINMTAAGASYGAIRLESTGSRLYLESGAVIISAATNSITADSAATNLNIYGDAYSNKSLNANVVVNIGTYNVDSDVDF